MELPQSNRRLRDGSRESVLPPSKRRRTGDSELEERRVDGSKQVTKRTTRACDMCRAKKTDLTADNSPVTHVRQRATIVLTALSTKTVGFQRATYESWKHCGH